MAEIKVMTSSVVMPGLTVPAPGVAAQGAVR
jgi:hypothetical protein